jgi:hypothetical protein
MDCFLMQIFGISAVVLLVYIVYATSRGRRTEGANKSGGCPQCGGIVRCTGYNNDILPPPPGTNWLPLPRTLADFTCLNCGYAFSDNVWPDKPVVGGLYGGGRGASSI